MNPTTDYKICPACGQPAVLSMSTCGRCGHSYRTNFTPSATIVVPSATVPSKPKAMRLRAPIMLIALVGVLSPALILAGLHFHNSFVGPRCIGTWSRITVDGYEENGLVLGRALALHADGKAVGWSFEQPPNTPIDAHPRYLERTTWHADGNHLVFDEGAFDGYLAGNQQLSNVYEWSVSDDGKRLTLTWQGFTTVWERQSN